MEILEFRVVCWKNVKIGLNFNEFTAKPNDSRFDIRGFGEPKMSGPA